MTRPEPTGATSLSGQSSAARLARLGTDAAVRGGLLSVQESAALTEVGFASVSEVLGAAAVSVRAGDMFHSGAMMGSLTLRASDPRVFTSSMSELAGSSQTVTALKSIYRTVLTRLREEAVAVGADGVVDVRIERDTPMAAGRQVWTMTAVGTAVRNIGVTHTAAPFVTTLPAAQVAAALRGGWLPISMMFCPVMAIRYAGLGTRHAHNRRAPNGEVDAFTDIVSVCRRQARDDFAAAARDAHADGAVLTSMEVTFEASKDDPVCQVTVLLTGTALTRFDARSRPGPTPLTIMPLTDPDPRR